jgi:hypothetical protein
LTGFGERASHGAEVAGEGEQGGQIAGIDLAFEADYAYSKGLH